MVDLYEIVRLIDTFWIQFVNYISNKTVSTVTIEGFFYILLEFSR